MELIPAPPLSTHDFEYKYVLRNYDSLASVIMVEYWSDSDMHLPLSQTFHAAPYVNSDGSLNEEKLHADIKRNAPIFYWRSLEQRPNHRETFANIMNEVQVAKASETEAVLQERPIEETYGWPEKLHTLNKQRNLYLYATDWTEAENSPLDEETKAQWKIWRQKIRDMGDGITPDVDPTSLLFPEPPGGWKDFLNKNVVVFPGINSFNLRPYTDEQLGNFTKATI